ncbi:MAG: MFS transporter [Chloroflexota bacterium]
MGADVATVAAGAVKSEPELVARGLRWVRARLLGVLFAGQVLGGIATTAGLSVSSIAGADLGGSNSWSGVPGAINVLGAGVAALPLSRAMGRIGRRAGLVWGYSLGTLGGVLCAAAVWTNALPLLLLGMLLFGVGNTSNQLARYAAADTSPPSTRGRAISLIVWAATVGALLGPTMFTTAETLGQRLGLAATGASYLLSVVAYALAGLLLLGALRPDPRRVAQLIGGGQPTAGAGGAARGLRELLSLPGVRLAIVGLTVSHLVMIAPSQLAPVLLRDHGHPMQVIGFVVAGHVAGMFAISPLTGVLCDRLGPPRVIVGGLFCLILAVLVAATAPPSDAVLVGLGQSLLGVGWNFGFVASSALLTSSVSREEQPTVQGLADLVMGVGAAAGTALAGALLGGVGFSAMSLLVGATLAAPLALLWWYRGSMFALPSAVAR